MVAPSGRTANRRHRLSSSDHLECRKRWAVGSRPREWQLAVSVRGIHLRYQPARIAPRDRRSLRYAAGLRSTRIPDPNERLVSKDDLINAVWNGRVILDAALTTRLNAARSATGDPGE